VLWFYDLFLVVFCYLFIAGSPQLCGVFRDGQCAVCLLLLVLWAVLGRIANAASNRMLARRIRFLQVCGWYGLLRC
jgi:hypothetical protein